MDLREIGWEGVDWMHVSQGRDQPVAGFYDSSGSINARRFID
jgi:hypothetical protein